MLNRAEKLANIIEQAKEVHIVTHNDADGLTAGAIASSSLQRLDKTYTLECVKQLDRNVLKRLKDEDHELVWFTDLGSSISSSSPEIKKIITDHHACSQNAEASFHLNPHLFGLDGSVDISGAGLTYLVAKQLNSKNIDLSMLAIIGALGDLQDRKDCRLQGINRDILKDAEEAKMIQAQLDIRYFGRETRPMHKLLQFSSDPFIPGLTGREEACISFLQDLKITLKDNDTWRKWIDLNKEEKRRIMSNVARLLLQKGFSHKTARRVIGEVYLLRKEKKGTELHDAKEFATLLNATARYGKAEVGINVCLGDRDKWLKQARSLLRGHRHNLAEGLQVARENGIIKRDFLQFFHAKKEIRDTIVGIVAGMLLNSEDISSSLPLIGFVDTENNDVKASARATRDLVDQGLNLSSAMRKAAEVVNGVGGGHNIAAGATIPKGKEEEFLDLLEKEISIQLSN